jgi:hypothetical protein
MVVAVAEQALVEEHERPLLIQSKRQILPCGQFEHLHSGRYVLRVANVDSAHDVRWGGVVPIVSEAT